MNLKTMSVPKLTKLRDQVDAALRSSVAAQRKTIEAELSRLSRFAGGSSRARAGNRGIVAPKYRNPENHSETWAGRGLKPRWLTAALKSGKKIEEFLIAGATAAAKAIMPKKRGRKPKE